MKRCFILFCWLMMCLGIQAKGQLMEIATLKERLEADISKREKAGIYNRLGMLYTMRTLDSCYYYAIHGLELSREIRDKGSEADAMNVLGFYYMEKGNPYLAYKFVNESLAIFRRLGNRERICELTMNLGVLLGMEGKPDQSQAKLEAAYSLSTDLERDSIRALVLLNLAVQRGERVPYFQLEPLFEEAIAIARRNQDERTLLSILQTRALTKYESGLNEAVALSEQKEISRTAELNGYEYLFIRGLFEVGYIYLREYPDSAQVYFQRSIDLAGETGYEGLQYHLNARAYDLMRNVPPLREKAAEYGAKLLEISRQRYLEREGEGFGFMELAIKEKELEAQQAGYRLRRTLMWGGFLAALLSVLVAVLMYRQYRIKQRLVKDFRRTNEDLRRTNARLEENDDFHKKVIAILSHDLRQPFSAIHMFSDRMLADLDKTDLNLLFSEMRQSATVSLQVMDGLLHWMKAQTIGSGNHNTAVSIDANIREALRFNEFEIRKRNLRIDLQVDNNLWASAQNEMLLFVHRNILHNAIKYTPDGGLITISATILPPAAGTGGPDELVVCISDTGTGIPEGILEQLFKKQTGPDAERDRKNKGTGLAMIICYEMMDKMGATLWAENNTDGPGASFYYRLPRAGKDMPGAICIPT